MLATAANLFRQRGYRDASIAELEKATGLVAGSIYHAFGDKSGLFKAALQHYVDGFVRARLDGFLGSEARLEDLEAYFLSVLTPPLSDGYGCLVTNSIVEFGRDGGLASQNIEETLRFVRERIGEVLKREIDAGTTETDALRLTILYHGVLTLSRSPTPFEQMAAAVISEFDRLKALRRKSTSNQQSPNAPQC